MTGLVDRFVDSLAQRPSRRPAPPQPVQPAAVRDPLQLDPVQRALEEVAAGRPVVVVDDPDRENEGDLVLAASLATPETVAFVVRHTSGVVCVALPGPDLDRLALPPMVARNEDPKGTAYTVSVDAREGVSTGISAADRARTLRLLADPATRPQQLTRPGHVFPLRAVEGGVLRRRGHTEAAVDLTRLAGLPPAGAIAEVVDDDGSMARLPRLLAFAREHGLAIVSIADLVAHRQRTEALVERVAATRLPTTSGSFQAVGYRAYDGSEHLALLAGDISDGADVLVRVHSECLTGDVLGSLRCDCGEQLARSLAAVRAEGRGVVLYLRGHEGRGVGLLHKLQAYALQDAGADTVDANLELGLPVDARDYVAAAAMLRELGVRSVRLLTNNPAKHAGLETGGIRVLGRVALPTTPNPENARYLQVKRDRMGHDLEVPGPATPGVGGPA